MTSEGNSTGRATRYGDASGRARAELIVVALADDHPFVLAGARILLEAMPEIALVGESSSLEAGLALLARVGPDLAVLDVSMPRTDAIEVVQHIAQICPSTSLVTLMTCENGDHIRGLIHAGVRGCVLKRSAAENLTRAIRAVARGGMYLDPAMAAQAVGVAVTVAAPSGCAQLSAREADVLRLMARGYSNKEIGARLAISVKSVETYKARAVEKLGLRTRADVVRYAVKHGWLEEAG